MNFGGKRKTKITNRGIGLINKIDIITIAQPHCRVCEINLLAVNTCIKNITFLCKKKKRKRKKVQHIECCTLMGKKPLLMLIPVLLYFTESFRPVCLGNK